jgi:ankyrin repeat protein
MFIHYLGCSALHTAARSGNADCIEKLLQYKVRVGSQDPDKMTALHHAGEKWNLNTLPSLYI